MGADEAARIYWTERKRAVEDRSPKGYRLRGMRNWRSRSDRVRPSALTTATQITADVDEFCLTVGFLWGVQTGRREGRRPRVFV